jgi:hypothetical protein
MNEQTDKNKPAVKPGEKSFFKEEKPAEKPEKKSFTDKMKDEEKRVKEGGEHKKIDDKGVVAPAVPSEKAGSASQAK